jgi:hypothetical protein
MRAALLCLLSVCFNMEPPEALPDAVTRIQLASASRLMQIWPNGVQQKLGFTSQIFVSDNIRLTNLCAYAPESALAHHTIIRYDRVNLLAKELPSYAPGVAYTNNFSASMNVWRQSQLQNYIVGRVLDRFKYFLVGNDGNYTGSAIAAIFRFNARSPTFAQGLPAVHSPPLVQSFADNNILTPDHIYIV